MKAIETLLENYVIDIFDIWIRISLSDFRVKSLDSDKLTKNTTKRNPNPYRMIRTMHHWPIQDRIGIGTQKKSE